MFYKDIRIRTAGIYDAQALLEIYAPYVEHTAITFEYETPKRSDFQKRIENTLKKYPYIVAETDGEISRAQHILNLNACIACCDVEDEYLTNDSVAFHSRLGYTMVGKFHQCGYKFGRWYDMVWMEKRIGEHRTAPAPVILFPDLSWTVKTVNETQ